MRHYPIGVTREGAAGGSEYMPNPTLRTALLIAVAVAAVAVVAAPATADGSDDCGSRARDPTDDGGVVGASVEDTPPVTVRAATPGGDTCCTERVSAERQDDGDHAPVDADAGWQGEAGLFIAVTVDADGTIDEVETQDPGAEPPASEG